MQRRWLLALVLATGCGNNGGGAPDGDAGKDATGADTVSERTDSGPREVGGEVPADLGPDRADVRDGGGDADAPVEAPPDGLSSLCPAQIPMLTANSGTVTGFLGGTGTNPAVSCRGGLGTPGPEAFFTLKLDQAQTIDLIVASVIDTVIAVRPGTCAENISEVACSEASPSNDADGGIQVPAVNDAGVPLNLTEVRRTLAAGTYTIIVDTYSSFFSAATSFTLTVGKLQARPNATCGTPTLLTPGTAVRGEPIDLGGAPRAVCGGSQQSSLFYSVGVPSGQRLTVRATPVGGDRQWMPRIQAFASCAATSCLTQGRLVSGAAQQLDWTNNSASWQLVYLAVGSDTPVSGGSIDLTATVVDLFATCGRPTAVKDGTNLLGQDLSLASSASGTCSGVNEHAFYYTAVLLPTQSISVQAIPSGGGNVFSVPIVSVRSSCDQGAACTSNGSGADFTNDSNAEATVLIEVSSRQPGLVGLFDLMVTIPDPPAGVIVKPTGDLSTTEAGGTATFTVVLTSPPTADVTIGVASDTPAEGTASPATLVFTKDSWKTPQTVTVKGVDDQASDGPRAYTIVTSAATSADARYMGFNPDDVGAVNLDDDPGITFGIAGDVVTSESGATTTFTVALNAAPTAPVTMSLTSTDVSEGTVSPAQVTFTATNWNVPQPVTVTGVDDVGVDGTQVYTIVTGALSSTDARYGGQNPGDLTARNLDDDQVAVPIKILSGNDSCSVPGTQTLPMAVDRAGRLYIVMPCEGTLKLTTSTDGGVTFSAPVEIPGTGNLGNFPLLAAGAPGYLSLLYGANDGNVLYLRSTDAGLTWSSPIMMSNRQDFMQVDAGEKTVFVLTPGPEGTDKSMLSRSLNGGRSFTTSFLDGSALSIAVAPDGKTAWLLNANNNQDLRKSTDGGATFTKVADLNTDVQFHLVGNKNLFTVPSFLQIRSLADTSMVTSLSNATINLPPFAMAVDDLDSLAILFVDFSGRLSATRVPAGATTLPDSRVIGPNPQAAGLAILSRKAAAVAFVNGSIVLYQTIVW